MAEETLQVDRNLQAIRAIEGAWSLPSVPDEVKLDLAGNTMMNPQALGSFFNGLQQDLEEAGRREPFPTRSDVGDDTPQRNKQTQLGIQIAGATGLPAPQVLDIRAPQRLKQQLFDGGYLNLTPEEIQSDMWLPEYSFAARELNFDNQSREFQGEKPGSTSLDQIFGFVDEWLSPRGLYRAAVELDLWWDFDQIGTEFEEWGDKLEAWNEDRFNPRKLIDLATGPLDDILFPILNVALMFTGFSEVVAVARGIHIGLKGAQHLAGLYRGAKGIKFAQAAAETGISAHKLKGALEVARFAEPSFVGRKVSAALGHPAVMTQWRRNSAVIMGKKINQQALRAGFSSNLQQAIDSDRGTKSLDHFTGGAAGDRVYSVFSEPLFDWGVDILLMPRNIWNVGTFSKPAKATLAIVQRGFRKASENQDLLLSWDRPVRRFLEELDMNDPYSIQVLDNLGVKTPKQAVHKFKRLSEKSMGDALAQTLFDSDLPTMGGAMGFVAVMAGFDQHARGLAEVMVGTPLHQLNSTTRRAFRQAQNTLTAQLTNVDPDNIQFIFDHWAKYGADLEKVATGGSRRADVFYKNRRLLEEGYLESVDEMATRAGAVPDGHTRYVGEMDPDTGHISFRPEGSAAIPTGGTPSGVPGTGSIGASKIDIPYKLGEGTASYEVAWDVGGGRRIAIDEIDNVGSVRGKGGRIELLSGEVIEVTESVAKDVQRGMRETGDALADVNLSIDEWRSLAPDDVPGVAGIDEDPFFVDIFDDDIRRAVPVEGDTILSGAEELPDVFARRYLRHGDDGAIRHNRLSEAPGVRTYKPEELEKIRKWVQQHNDLRAEKVNDILSAVTPASLEQYVYEVLPTFGRWNEFTEGSAEVAQSMLRGELDNAKFVSVMSDSNRRMASMPWTPSDVKWTDEMFAVLLELPGDEKLTNSLMEGVFSVFARNVDPQRGSFTLALKGTVSKQEAEAFRATARRIVKMITSVRKIKAMPDSENIFRVTTDHAKTVDRVATPGLREALAEAVGAVADTDTVKQLALLSRYADEAGVTLDDVEKVLLAKLGDINLDPRWAERFQVPTQLGTGDLVQEVSAKIRELKEQAYFMASEVENVPQALLDNLDKKGYKLVYGVEFAQPLDMDGILPHFAEAAREHVRLKALGDFVSRQDPKAISELKARKVREALHATLGPVDQKDGRPLNFGPGPDKTNADQNRVLKDLWEILDEVHETGANRLSALGLGHFTERIATRVSLARIPFDLTRLASDLTFKGFISKIKAFGYNDKQARAIYKSLQKSQALGFRTHGLYAIESKLRSEPNLLNILRLLGTTAEGDGFRKMRSGMGAVLGAYAANLTVQEGDDLLSFERMGKTLAGTVIGGAVGASKLGLPGVRGGVDFLETSTNALKYAYMADYVANLRDLVRFSLSPIFDASRYSEAFILNQLGDLPPNVTNLRINQSPRGFRRLAAREWRAKGKGAEEAKHLATKEWETVQGAFGEAANNLRDFDWEVIDGVGRRFASVGVLGFSPVDWMQSTFGHLVKAGASTTDAYKVVRDIYTYGTTGRSAAELSMNFVFFPFSFTKKTVTHFAKFFSDDLSRLIVTHDMLATYQLLNEKYNLTEEWKDRLPILEKFHRLNLTAYGVGLGRFGGVNAAIIEAGVNATARIPGFQVLEDMPGPSAIVNMFIPQMVPMNTTEDANTLWDSMRGVMPVMNDVTTMVNMLVDQAYVVGSEEHLTKQAEQRKAWGEWRAFQQEVADEIEPAGFTWKQAVRNPEINFLIQQRRTEISARYPAWKQGLGDGISHGVAIDMELKERIQFPKSAGDEVLSEFDFMLNAIENAAGATFSTSPESMPPEAFRVLRNLAIQMSREVPEFLRLYNRFYRRNLGDIMTDVTA